MCFHCKCIEYKPTIVGEYPYSVIKKSILRWGLHVIWKQHLGGDIVPTSVHFKQMIDDCLEYCKVLKIMGITPSHILVSRSLKKYGWEHFHGWISIDYNCEISKKKFSEIFKTDKNGNFIAISPLSYKDRTVQKHPNREDTVTECKLSEFEKVFDTVPLKNTYVFITDLDNLLVKISY